MNRPSAEPLYRIKSVVARTGISAATLRAWERRYGFVAPGRSTGGYRLYSEDDLASLMRVKEMLDAGLAISEAIAAVTQRAQPRSGAAVWTATQLGLLRDELRLALEAMDRPRASEIAARLAPLPFARTIEEVLVPVLRRIGERWEHGEASVAQEHFASAFVRERLSAMREALEHRPRRHGPEVVCAGAPGDTHDLGLLAVTVHLELLGARVVYLGADVPLKDLRGVLQQRRPAVLCTSCTVRTAAAECRELALALRALAPARTRVVVGGAGVPPEAHGSPAPGVSLLPGVRELRSLLLRRLSRGGRPRRPGARPSGGKHSGPAIR